MFAEISTFFALAAEFRKVQLERGEAATADEFRRWLEEAVIPEMMKRAAGAFERLKARVEQVLGEGSFEAPDAPAQPPTNNDAAIFLALFDGNPMRRGIELHYDGYARAPLGPSTSAFLMTDGSTAVNREAAIFSPVAGTDAVTLTHWALFKARAGGEPIVCGRLLERSTLDHGVIPAFPSASLRIAFDPAAVRS